MTLLNDSERKDSLDAINRRAYATPKVSDWYADLNFIHKPEEVILRKLGPLIKGKKLLDIGIGGGRTTRFLLEISADYTGIDYTPRCVQIVKNKYPESNIVCGDARNLSLFNDASFDFVLFSFNGIDYVSHAERLKAMAEIYRVLRRRGFFMFSTHNRDYQHLNKHPWQTGNQFDLNLLKSSLYTIAHLPRHWRLKKHEADTDEYAIVNDYAHGFSLLTYCIGIDAQLKQLKQIGLIATEAYDMEGRQVSSDTISPWTYYLAQKP